MRLDTLAQKGIYDSRKVSQLGESFTIGPEMNRPDMPEGKRLVTVFVWDRTSLAVDISDPEMFEAFKRQYLRGNVTTPVFFLVTEENMTDCEIKPEE